MHVHFIAIGGSAMHNMAIALHKKGFHVTGSDDEIVEPSLSRLRRHGLLPEKEGWNPSRIHPGLDAVILGMHARADNPELLRARELGIRVYSYPEYIYEQSKDKTRVVIGGSHGKTTITAIILHVLSKCGKDFDYMVGAQLEGFDTMVKITAEAPLIILEGDEYLSSPVDRRPKLHLYKADIGLISGIAWDHINVFPTFEEYTKQFRIFAEQIPEDGTLIYCAEDKEVVNVASSGSIKCKKRPYTLPGHEIREGTTFLSTQDGPVPLQVFGEHNLMNIEGARLVCGELGIKAGQFYDAVRSFKGAARRLELVGKSAGTVVLKDFAHSPSKLKATTHAVKAQFPDRSLVACMELHTFSSLNESFLDQYKDSMNAADEAIVYFNPKTIEHKKLKPISEEQVRGAFGKEDIKVFTSSAGLAEYLCGQRWDNRNLLMMSSGNFDGLDLGQLARDITGKARVE
jgi:UDP-N-acetylmuramate: L-alanyl-gamma-D-glutamyl-meso-diaminopimelate ligase